MQHLQQTRMSLYQKSNTKLFWPIVILLASLALGFGSAVQGSEYIHYFLDLPYIGQLFKYYDLNKDKISSKQFSAIVLSETEELYFLS